MTFRAPEVRSAATPVRVGRVASTSPLTLLEAGGDDVPALSTLPDGALAAGSEVVIAHTADGTPIVLGVLGGADERAERLTNGYSLRVRHADAGSSISIADARGDRVLEVSVAEGVLTLSAPADMELRAGRTLRLSAPRVELGSGSDHPGGENDRTGVQIERSVMRLNAPELRINSENADLELRRLALRGERADARYDEADLTARRATIAIARLKSTVRTLFSEVKEVAQIQAARLRVLVSGSTQISSDEVHLRARQNVNIDGQKINLG